MSNNISERGAWHSYPEDKAFLRIDGDAIPEALTLIVIVPNGEPVPIYVGNGGEYSLAGHVTLRRSMPFVGNKLVRGIDDRLIITDPVRGIGVRVYGQAMPTDIDDLSDSGMVRRYAEFLGEVQLSVEDLPDSFTLAYNG